VSTTTVISRLRPDRESLVAWAAILNAELVVVLAYVAFISGPPESLRFLLLLVYPFVWLNLSVWACWRVDSPAGPRRQRALVGGLAAGYFLVLSYFGGVVQPGNAEFATGLRVALELPPGFSPALLFTGSLVTLNLLPFKVVGYLALSYLVYVTFLEAAGSAAAGVIGIFSCVSCTFPVVAGLVSGVTGGGAALAATIMQRSYWLSTVVFVVTVLLLVWRPTAADAARLQRAFDSP
jgi:hypothetical protein